MTIFTIPDGKGGTRMVGETVGTEFRKRVQRTRHFLRKPPGICIEMSVFEQLEAEMVELIRVRDDERMEYWEVPFERFNKHKFRIKRGVFENQYVLTLDWWTVTDREGTVIKEPRPETMEQASKDVEQSALCDQLLKEWKWEIGNTEHIRLRDLVTKLYRLRGRKTLAKKEIRDCETKIISLINYANKSKLPEESSRET